MYQFNSSSDYEFNSLLYYNITTNNSYTNYTPYFSSDHGTQSYQAQSNETVTKPMGEAEFVALINSIQQGTSSESLNLTGKGINNIRFISIINACSKQASKVIELLLSGNSIDDNGLNEIIPSLKENKKLKTLDLSSNLIKHSGFINLLTIFESNFTLIKLNIHLNDIPAESLLKLNPFITRNREIANEYNKIEYAIATIIVCRSASIPDSVIRNIILEYCSEAFDKQAREYIAINLYPNVIELANSLIESPMKHENEEPISPMLIDSSIPKPKNMLDNPVEEALQNKKAPLVFSNHSQRVQQLPLKYSTSNLDNGCGEALRNHCCIQ